MDNGAFCRDIREVLGWLRSGSIRKFHPAQFIQRYTHFDPKRIGTHQGGNRTPRVDQLPDFNRLLQHQGVARRRDNGSAQVQFGLRQATLGRVHRGPLLFEVRLAQRQEPPHLTGLDGRLQQVPLLLGNDLIPLFDLQFEFRSRQITPLGIGRQTIVLRINFEQHLARPDQATVDQIVMLGNDIALNPGEEGQFPVGSNGAVRLQCSALILGVNGNHLDQRGCGFLIHSGDRRPTCDQRTGAQHAGNEDEQRQSKPEQTRRPRFPSGDSRHNRPPERAAGAGKAAKRMAFGASKASVHLPPKAR